MSRPSPSFLFPHSSPHLPLSHFPFLISLCQQASPGAPHWGPPRFSSLPRGHCSPLRRPACPWAWAAEPRCSFALATQLSVQGSAPGGFATTGRDRLPAALLDLSVTWGAKTLSPSPTAALLQLISAFSWPERPGSGKALQNGN